MKGVASLVSPTLRSWAREDTSSGGNYREGSECRSCDELGLKRGDAKGV